MSDLGGFKAGPGIDLADVLEQLDANAEPAVRDAVEFLLTEANKVVPHDEGTLERSGRASADGARGAVSYDTPYAVRQHEDMSLHHDGKGKAKWLELTLAENRETVRKIVAARLGKGLG